MSPLERSRYGCSKRTLRLNIQDKESVKNGANRTNKIRSDKIQKNGRAELPTEKMRSDRDQKRKPAQKSTKGKNAGEKSG